MIGCYTDADGQLIIILSRCNAFHDHESEKLQGRDGDILLVCEPMGSIDHHDADSLISSIRERLDKHCLATEEEG